MKAIVCLLVCVSLSAAAPAQVPHRWDVDLQRPAVEDFAIARNETVSFEPRFTLGRSLYPIATGSVVRLYWSTNN